MTTIRDKERQAALFTMSGLANPLFEEFQLPIDRSFDVVRRLKILWRRLREIISGGEIRAGI